MPLFQKIFYILSFLFLIGAFIYLGTKDFNVPKKNLTDQESFTLEYGITKNNLFVYKSSQEILETLNTGTAIIFLGYPENKWSAFIAELLNEEAKKLGIKEIYYYNFKKDQSNNNHYYENIVRLLISYLPMIDTQSTNLYAPAVLVVKNGKIIYYDDETSIVRGEQSLEDYWTSEKIGNKRLEYRNSIQQILRDFYEK